MVIILVVLGVSGASIDTLVLHTAVRNVYMPLAPHSLTPPAGNTPDATPITARKSFMPGI